MVFQQVLASDPQHSMSFAEPPRGLEFPLSLTERYQPRRMADFIGLDRPKRLLSRLGQVPRSSSLLFIGPPGGGKSSMALAFADEAKLSLKTIPAQKCDVSAIDNLTHELAMCPPRGLFWVVLVDEADQMTDKAQLQLLSKLDGTAALKPAFGGNMVIDTAPPVIWIFTCNGEGPLGLKPPTSLLPRFLSRCMTVEFPSTAPETLGSFLQTLWRKEKGPKTAKGYFEYIATGVGVRDALMRLDSDLLAGPREVPARCACDRYIECGYIDKCARCSEPTKKVVSISTGDRSQAARNAWITRRNNATTKRKRG